MLSAIFIYTLSTAQTAKNVRVPLDFSKIKTSGAFDIKLIQSDKNEVTLFGDKEITVRILTVVEDGRLTIKPEKGFKLQETIQIEIRFKTIESIDLFGSGDLTSELIKAEVLKFSSRNSGDCILNAECSNLELNLSGSGDFRLSRKSSSMVLKSFGSGNIHAFEMASETISIESKGSGNTDLKASSTITGEAFGSGDIECIGGAKVDISKHGSVTIVVR